MKKLTPQQSALLQKALDDAFDKDALEQMLWVGLGKKLSSIVPIENKDGFTIIFKLIQRAEREGWTYELMAKAREWNPGNELLLEACQQIGLAPETPAEPELERVIKQENGFLNLESWRVRLAEIERQVCSVEVYSKNGQQVIYGTGFLLGSDVLMTNHHVVQTVIEGVDRPQDVYLRFDYKRLKDATVPNPGTIYRLPADNWLIDRSPMSPIDAMRPPKTATPALDQLDYALLRVDGNPGYERIRGGKHTRPSIRGWIKAASTPYNFQPNTALIIVQHPEHRSLQLAIDTQAIIGLNANGTRVTYRTNTEKGSSGAPCFNINWELVALHHSGDPNFDEGHIPEYNEGIPFNAILNLLEQRHLRERLENN